MEAGRGLPPDKGQQEVVSRRNVLGLLYCLLRRRPELHIDTRESACWADFMGLCYIHIHDEGSDLFVVPGCGGGSLEECTRPK